MTRKKINSFQNYFFILLCVLGILACNPVSDKGEEPILQQESKHIIGEFVSLQQKTEKVFIDYYGNPQHNLNFEDISQKVDGKISGLEHFHDGLAVVFYEKDDGTAKWGYINPQGENPFNTWFEYASEFENGWAIVKERIFWGAIDTKGKFIVEPKYIGMLKATDKTAWVLKDNQWFLFDIINNKTINNLEHKVLDKGKFENGICWIKNQRGKKVFINEKGETLSQEFDDANNIHQGLASVKKDNKWGLINAQGELILRPQFDYLGLHSEGLIPFINNDDIKKWGYIDIEGNVKIEPQFALALPFRNGLAKVKNKEMKVAFISKDGNNICDYKYDEGLDFEESLAAVRQGTKWGFINDSGNLNITPQFDKVIPFPHEHKRGGFSGGLAKVEVDAYQFFINEQGKCVLGCLEN